ncbi:MAG: CARDB domain-containing protein, partial [Planctomycetota bacterium]
AVDDQYVWTDGTEAEYFAWASGEPNTPSYRYVYQSSNWAWYDSPETSRRWGIVEIPDDGGLADGSGAGPLATYILDVNITDTVPPRVTQVSRLPDGGETGSRLSSFYADFSERLNSFNANTQVYNFATYGGNTYVYRSDSLRWTSAQSYAQSLGGNLVVLNDQDEQNFVFSQFGGVNSYWIGLREGSTAGDWSTWVDGTPVTYSAWSGSEPNNGGDFDFAITSTDGRWYDARSGWSYPAVIEIVGDADGDNDGLPDVIDWLPDDPINGYDLREAGADGIFDTADDQVYDIRGSYDGSQRVNFQVVDGPLQPGDYRFVISPSITDTSANAFDGNADGSSGDAFLRGFTVVAPDDGGTFEPQNNNSFANAAPLQLLVDPESSTLQIGRAYGSIDPSGDIDYWTFDASAGDLLSVMTETPGSGVDTRTYLYGSTQNYLTDDSTRGAGNDDYISRYQIPADGTYYLRVDRRSGSSVGDYITNVLLSTNLTHESDQEYRNDSLATADPVAYTVNGDQRTAGIVGTVMAGQSGNVDEDVFDLGEIAAGETILISSRLPTSSTLSPLVEIRDANNLIVSIGENPSDAVARADISTTGNYYAVILAASGSNGRSNYLVDVSVQPTDELNFADLVVSTVNAPTSAQSGGQIRVEWTVGNFGAVATPVDTWVDRIVLSSNDRFGDADDIPLGNVTRTGALDSSGSYTASADFPLPVGLSGTFNVLVKTDATANVPEFIFEENNVSFPDDPLEISLTPAADLATSDITLSATQALAGGPLQVQWVVTNIGEGVTADGTPGGTVSDWTDRVVLSQDEIFGNADDVLLADVPHSGELASTANYQGSWLGNLPEGLSNNYFVLVSTDFGAGFGAVYESERTANNTSSGGPLQVANQPYADLTVAWDVTPSAGVLGQTIDVAWTVTNNADNANGAADDPSWYDRIILSRDATVGNGDDRVLADVRHTGPLAIGSTYTDAATVTLPNDFSGDGFLFVVADGRSNVYEFIYEDNNASQEQPITVSAPDLEVSASLTTFAGVFGETIPIVYTVTNTGDATISGDFVDRIYLSSDASVGGDILLATVDSGQASIASGESYTRDGFLVTLPLQAGLSVGDYSIVVVTDATDRQPEADETNNSVITTNSINLQFPPLPDLQVENATATPDPAIAGSDVTVRWQTVNNGDTAVADGFNETVRVVNLSTGQTLLETPIALIPDVGDPIESGEAVDREFTFTLPDGPAGAGNLTVVITTDSDDQVIESFSGNVPETNNTATVSLNSTLPPYPDLIVDGVSLSETSLQSGEPLMVNWTILNTGTSEAAGDFVQRLRLIHRDSGNVLAESSVAYSAAVDGAIEASGSRPQSVSMTVPDGSESVGTVDVEVFVDSLDQIFEYNAAGNAETNNAASAPLSVILAPYADLSVSEVVAPVQTIADPATITVSYRVDNVGELAAQSDDWIDAVVASRDDVFGNSDDRVLATFARTQTLAVDGFYEASESFQLPPAFTGRYVLFVQADAGGAVFEDGRLANNADRSPDVFDVMPIPYADLVITDVTPAPTGASGQPLELSWTVQNQGIGLTNRANWNDLVYVTDDPTGQTGRRFLGSFAHLGQLAVDDQYSRTVMVTLPNGLSGQQYFVVQTGGPFEFIYTDNNTTVSGPVDVTFSDPPDLVVTDIDAPTLDVLEGTLIDIGWTVRNDGAGDAEGSWEDRLYLRKVGEPNAPVISLGTYRYQGPLPAGQTYTRREQVRLPVRTFGLYEAVVVTNFNGELFEHTFGDNNQLVDDTQIPITVRPRPDLQVISINAPDEVDPGQTIALEFTVTNQGSVATTVPNWQDRAYLSLDPVISSDDVLIATLSNQSALESGQSYFTQTESAVVPLRFRGTVYLIVQTDAGGAMEEWPNDGNNTAYRELYVTPQPLPDLVTGDVVAPTQAIEGAEIEVRYTVSNFGPGTTPVENWTDTVWLTRDRNRPHPGQGDFLLRSLSHSGTLVTQAGYDVVTRVTLPTGLESGTYYITPWTDPYAVVLEDTLAINVNPDDPTEIDNNNYKARAIDIIALNIPDPDLTVEEIVVDPVGTGGETYSVQYRVANIGLGDANGSWIDQVWLTDDPDGPVNSSTSMLLREFPRSGVPNRSSYDEAFEITLSPSAIGSHVVVVTDYRNTLGETDEDNNDLTVESVVTPRAADLQVTDIQVSTGARSGEEVTVTYTVENTGDQPVWTGTQYWTDHVWISADVQFIRSRSSYLGQAIHSNTNTLQPGESYTQSVTGFLPEGIEGEFFAYIHPNTNVSTRDNQLRTVSTAWWPADTGTNQTWLDTFYRSVYEDPFNNVVGEKFDVEYFEADLVPSALSIPSGLTSGQTVDINYRVTNAGTRATRLPHWVDRVFLSRDDSLDRFDTQIGVFQTSSIDDFEGLEVGEFYDAIASIRIPDGIEGEFNLLVISDSPAGEYRRIFSDIGFRNFGVRFDDPRRLPDDDRLFEAQRLLARGRILEYQQEGNNTIQQPVDVTLAAVPDLQVTALDAPQRVRAGQPFDVEYTVTNLGGRTPPAQAAWTDLVYLSRDEFLDLRSDRYLGQIPHGTGLTAGDSYTVTESFTAPSGFADETEEYYVFVITDPPRYRPQGDVFELDQENNNSRRTPDPIVIELPPPTDLQVVSVSPPTAAQSGDAVSISYTVRNESDTEPAIGTWSDTLYLSADGVWDLGDVPLGRVSFSGSLAPGEDYTQTLETRLPPAIPGQYRVIVRTDIFNQVYEREFDANNTLPSAETLDVTVPALELDKPLTTTLSTGQTRLFELEVPFDQTLQVTLSTDAEDASNELFIRYDAAPTIAAFDAAYEGGLASELRAVIPSTQPGKYYVLIRGFSQPADDTPVTLLAKLLPLAITDINTDVGGDSKYVTTTIEGARFHPDAAVKLVRPGFAEFVPAAYEVIDSTKIIATFDFTDATHGLYDVVVTNPGDETATVPYRFLIEQAITPDVTIGVGGPRAILAGDVGTYSVALQSISNLDTPYVHFTVGIPEMLTNEFVYDLPFVRFDSNVRGAPDGRDDIPWAEINSSVNADPHSGSVSAPGYLFDSDANGFTGFSFNLSTYPGLQELHDRAWEELVAIIYAEFPELEEEGTLDDGPDGLDEIYDGLTELYNQLAAVPGECEIPFIPFRFHLTAAATAMTRDEFITHALGEAETLRQAIIDDDSTVNAALLTLAADRDNWGDLFLAALEEGGLLREEDDIPPIREREKIVSTMATLATGILIGPTGEEIRTSGSLLDFFDDIRRWYGHDPGVMGDVEFYDPRTSDCFDGSIPVPEISTLDDYDLGLSTPTHFESFRVYVPWIAFEDRGAGLPADFQINGPAPVDRDEFAGLDLTQFLDPDAVAGLASMTGPQTVDTQGWLPLGQRLPYSVNFVNAPDASRHVQEVRVVTQLDEDLDIYSFRLGDLKIGKIDVNIPNDRALFQGEFDFSETEGFNLRISAGVDQSSREATWLIQAIDPLTGELLQDETRGILAPNNAQGHGEAFVSYTILPDDTQVQTGDEVSADAQVLFNSAPPEQTPTISQPIDTIAPGTTLTVATVAGQTDNYTIDWSVADDADGSGFRHVTLYVATDGGDYQIWQRQLTDPIGSAVYEGSPGKAYQFLALATDVAGNQETPGVGITAQPDGTSVNLGAPQTVPDTTPPNFGIPPEPSPQPSTNPLFTTAEALIPAAEVIFNPSEFDEVLRPFVAGAFVTGIEQSNAEIGPMAIVETPEGDVIVSGGQSRSSLFRFDSTGGEALNPWAQLPYPVFNLAFDADGRLWATTGGGPLLQLDPDTGGIVAEHGDGITMAMAVHPDTGEIYLASGAVWSGGVNGQYGGAGGVQVFDPETET